jgi:hypothetical protein
VTRTSPCLAAFPLVVLATAGPAPISAQDIDLEPIRYSSAAVDDPVVRLNGRLERGAASLAFEERFGYLPAVLRELGVSGSTQALVFSKTSFQRERISPEQPRALYFGDDVYVGWVQGGEVIEVAAQDPRQGSIFYTLEQKPAEKPRFERQNAECLQCHASTLTKGVPGVLVRSVKPDRRGFPILKLGTHLTDHSSPLPQRWGGWYVSGEHGAEPHLGNLVFSEGEVEIRSGAAPADLNAESAAGRFHAGAYLSPHSDIVALLVLEHQVGMHNLLTSAGYQARIALHQQAAMSAMLGERSDESSNKPSESTLRRFGYASTPLLKYLLFADEAELKAPVRGPSGFAAEFAARGPRDPSGRSLRDLDLERRLFKYPLSYLIYSQAFDALPAAFKEHVYLRLWEILTGKDESPDFARLKREDRQAVLEILSATKTDLPESWRTQTRERARD